MTPLSESFKKVQYDVRPAKQAERRMLIDAFQLLGHSGFPILEYQYTGMGSIYFVDYILFHKYLGITKMLSVELAEGAKKRVEFNKPFGSIEIQIGAIGSFIPTLSSDLQHILWLDYDHQISSDSLADIVQACSRLTAGSILLITIDLEPPGPKKNGPEQWREYFNSEAGTYISQPNEKEDFALSKLQKLNIDIVQKAIKAGLNRRRNVEFLPLFNFLYADGHQMLTLGGMIASAADKRRVRGSKITETSYYRDNFDMPPYEIKVPRLTKKERMHLDSKMPCKDGWVPVEFELTPAEVADYREVHKFLPSYFEAAL